MQRGRTGILGSTPSEESLFHEVQRFRHWFFWVPVLIATGMVWWLFGQQVLLDHPQGSEPIPDWLAWVLTILFGIGLPAFALIVRMVTQVRPGELSVRFVPILTRRITVADIAEAESREYSAMREFGGWGIRVASDGRAYNAHGSQGVQLTLKDGSRILVGTQRPQELVEALRSAGAGVP